MAEEMEVSEITYGAGRITRDELRGELEAFWGELRTSGELREEVRAAEIDPDELLGLDPGTAVEVRQDGEPIGEVVAIVIVFGPTINHVAQSLWDEVVLPWLRRRRGGDALGPERGRS
jgi:hypothetical protein